MLLISPPPAPRPARPNLKYCHGGRDSLCVHGTQGAAFLGGCSGVNGGPQKVVPVPNPSSCEATLLGERVSATATGAWDEVALPLGPALTPATGSSEEKTWRASAHRLDGGT